MFACLAGLFDCLFVYLTASRAVRRAGWIDAWMDGGADGRDGRDGWRMAGWMNGWMERWMDGIDEFGWRMVVDGGCGWMGGAGYLRAPSRLAWGRGPKRWRLSAKWPHRR